MSRIALYQKYRSQTFDEVIGQDYVVRSIRNAVKEQKVGHAYLFCGPRGTGKTTMARLLARSINCEHPEKAPCGECPSCKAALAGTHPDIIEINAANETHVEDIRDLIERARLAPMMSRHKVYIIDEVHQLSSAASSALLKTLEEPPEHVVFILATTDPQKMLKTIISRCQRFDFSKVDTGKIKDHLLDIAGKEGFVLDEAAALKIAELSDGGMRDALSILEQASSYAGDHISEDSIDEIFGLTSTTEEVDLLKDILDSDMEGILTRVRSFAEHGTDFRRLSNDLVNALKDAIIYQGTTNADLLHHLNAEQASKLSDPPMQKLLGMARVMMKAQPDFAMAQSQETCFTLACFDMMMYEQPSVQVVQKTEGTPAENMLAYKPLQPQPVSFEPVRAAAPVQTAPVQQTPEVKREEVHIPVEQPQLLSAEDVISILVSCNKACKQEVQEKLNMIMDPSVPMNRWKNMLRQVKLGAASDKAVLLFAGSQAAVNTMMCESTNRGLYEYLKENGIDRMPYVIQDQEFTQACHSFAARMKDHTLPEAKEITFWSRQEAEKGKTENDPEQRVMALYGAENVKVIDQPKGEE